MPLLEKGLYIPIHYFIKNRLETKNQLFWVGVAIYMLVTLQPRSSGYIVDTNKGFQMIYFWIFIVQYKMMRFGKKIMGTICNHRPKNKAWPPSPFLSKSLAMASSLWQNFKNSSFVTSPSEFKSILWKRFSARDPGFLNSLGSFFLWIWLNHLTQIVSP